MSFTDRLTARDERIKTLENTCKDLAKDLGDALKAGAENVRDYQKLLADAQKEISRLTSIIETEQIIGKAEWRKGKELEAKIEAVNDKIQAFEKWLALGTPFESAKFDRSKVLEEYRKFFEINFPRNREQKQEENSVELLHRYRNEYAEQGNEENKENTTP